MSDEVLQQFVLAGDRKKIVRASSTSNGTSFGAAPGAPWSPSATAARAGQGVWRRGPRSKMRRKRAMGKGYHARAPASTRRE
jgi:hypothetical protein